MSKTLINCSELEDFVKNDPQLLMDLYVIFVRHLPDLLTNLELAVELQDAKQLCESAHRLKGQLSYFFCDSLIEQALEIENLANCQNMKSAAKKLKDLTDGIDGLITELNRLTKLELQVRKD